MMLLSNIAALALCLASANAVIMNVSPAVEGSTTHSIQSAINRAIPGDVIQLKPGLYLENIESKKDGKANAPITIRGPTTAIIRATEGDVIRVAHDHIHLEGFSVEGAGSDADDEVEELRRHGNHLLHVFGNRVRDVFYASHIHRSAIVGFEANGLSLSKAGNSCLKLSSFVTHATVINNDISKCGKAEAICVRSEGGCGAGIDIGTTISDVMQNVDGEVDETAWNKIAHNHISKVSGACIVTHEGAQLNIIDGNTCRESRDEHGAGVDIRGDMNIVRNNKVQSGSGAGLGIGGAQTAVHRYGVFNQVYLNELTENVAGSILNGVIPEPAGVMCKNLVDDDALQELIKECPDYMSVSTREEEQLQHGMEGREDALDGSSESDKSPTPCEHAEGETMESSDLGVYDSDKHEPSATRPSEKYRGDDGGEDATSGGAYVCHEVPLSPGDVKSSEVGEETVGNGPEVVLQKDDRTHWSRYGVGQWIEFALSSDSSEEPLQIEAIKIKVFRGDSRVQYFKILADDQEVISEGVTSGETDAEETFLLDDGPVHAYAIRIVGGGNVPNDPDAPFSPWNSFVTVKICQKSADE